MCRSSNALTIHVVLEENTPSSDQFDQSEAPTDPVSRIIKSARENIEKRGILGLRVAEVAKGANSSITQIYRYFGNRDGLLARVLGDLYEEFLTEQREGYFAMFRGCTNVTIDDIVNSIPGLTEPSSLRNQEIRLQILAASVTNQELRERLTELTKDTYEKWNAGLSLLEQRLAPGTKFDRRVITVGIFTQMGYYRNLLGDAGWSTEEYRAYLKDKFACC